MSVKNPNDYFRRWYSDDDFDLIVWYEPTRIVYGFELSYDKPYDEKVLKWLRDRGITHYSVDNGAPSPLINQAAMLVTTNGRGEMTRVLSRFRKVDNGLPRILRSLNEKDCRVRRLGMTRLTDHRLSPA